MVLKNSARHKEKGSAGFCTTRSPKQSGGLGLGGWGPPLVYRLKQDRGDLVPVDRVKKQTRFNCRKKASAEPHA